MPNILIIEDVEEIGEMLTQFVQVLGFSGVHYSNFAEVSIEDLNKAEHIILDLNMPKIDGMDVLEHLSEIKLKANIILCSGMSADILDAAADVLTESGLRFGGILNKPFSIEDIKTLLEFTSSHKKTAQLSTNQYQQVVLTRLELILALKNNWFYPMFQPQLDINSNTLFGIECLARLNHPLLGSFSPDIFIEKLVEYDLIDEFTEKFIVNCLSQLQKIQFPSTKRISFNIDPHSLNKPFLTKILNIFSDFDIDNEQVCLEITELSVLETSKEIKSVLTKLRVHGVNISLDDFGTGFSTIHELDHLPFSELKIDKSFVENITTRVNTKAIVKHMIDLAQDINVLLVAEGIETEEQALCLKDMGCQYMQGFLYAQPLDLEDLFKFVTRGIAVA